MFNSTAADDKSNLSLTSQNIESKIVSLQRELCLRRFKRGGCEKGLKLEENSKVY